MAIYQCPICGVIFDEEEEGRKLEELTVCPVCKQPVSRFERIDDGKEPEMATNANGSLAYDSQYARQDKHSRYMKEIHEMAVSGKSLDSSMGTRMPLPNWDDILLLGAQLNPPPLLDHDPVETRTVIGKHARKPMVLEYIPNKYSVTDDNLRSADAIEIKIGQGTLLSTI